MFSLPWSHYGPQRPKNKMEAKSTKKMVSTDFVECAQTIVFSVWEAHGQVPGRLRRPCFFALAGRRPLKGSQGVLGTISGDLGSPLGVIWATLGAFPASFFQASVPGPFLELWGMNGLAAVVHRMGGSLRESWVRVFGRKFQTPTGQSRLRSCHRLPSGSR